MDLEYLRFVKNNILLSYDLISVGSYYFFNEIELQQLCQIEPSLLSRVKEVKVFIVIKLKR